MELCEKFLTIEIFPKSDDKNENYVYALIADLKWNLTVTEPNFTRLNDYLAICEIRLFWILWKSGRGKSPIMGRFFETAVKGREESQNTSWTLFD
jgi:hypothetical protein